MHWKTAGCGNSPERKNRTWRIAICREEYACRFLCYVFFFFWLYHDFLMDWFDFFTHILQGCFIGSASMIQDANIFSYFHKKNQQTAGNAWPVDCGLSMWGKIMIPMYKLWLHSWYGLYGPRCPLSPERPQYQSLTYSLAMHGCVLSTVATDVLVLKHQAISIHCADQISIALIEFRNKNITFIVSNIRK